ncbi:MAG: hypothetical protein ACM31C_06880 [Acidobacteriota bacterium]
MADRIVRGLLAALLAIGTIAWARGREGHGLPTADLHADAPYYYVYLPSLLHGDLDFTDEYRETKNWYHLGLAPTGRPANAFGIGPAVLDAPLFLVGHAAALATGSRDDGFSTWEIRLYTWSSLAWSLAAVVVAYRLARRRLGGGALALAGPLACALAGPVVYYAVRQPGYAHPMATFFAALLVDRWDASYDSPRTWKTWLVLGAVLGAGALARPQLALWGVVLAGAAIDDLRARRSWRVVLPWLAGAAAAVVVFAPQLVAWRVVYGDWWVVPQGPGFMRWDAPCWSEVLFSSRNGLLPWAPAYAVFAVALVALARAHRRLVGFVVAGVALQTLANGAVWDWWGGGSFGGRRFDSTYVAFALGAAGLVAWIARAVPPAVRRAASWRVRARGVAAALVAAIVLDLIVVNLWLAGKTTTTNARITGGEPAPAILGRLPGGSLAAAMSALSNLPARAAFAWRHDTSLDAYDRVVGVHVLGETYPGLNSFADQRTATLPAPALAGGRAHVLIGLNRAGGLDVTLDTDATTIEWNGTRVPPHFHTDDLRRGTNDLVLAGATHAGPIHLAATN